MLHLTFRLIALGVLLAAGSSLHPRPAAAQTAPKPSAKPDPAKAAAARKCVSTCEEYRKATLRERQQALKSGCPNYVSAISDPVVARIRLAPELAGHMGSAVDDELWLEINGKDVWHRSFRNKDTAETAFKKDVLKDGCNTLNLFYANTQEPDAYFMVDVGGLAFCGVESSCSRKYREGLRFGTGLIYKVPAVHEQLWDSALENPNANGVCRCEDPGLDELYGAMGPYVSGLHDSN